MSHRPATLTYIIAGVDTSATYTFTFQCCHDDACTLTGTNDDTVAIAPRPTRHLGTYTCSGLAHGANGYLVAQICGQEGDITVPAT